MSAAKDTADTPFAREGEAVQARLPAKRPKRPIDRWTKREELIEKPPTEAELLRACEVISLIIAAYGDTYWPIMDRLEKELETIRTQRDRLTKYLVSGQTIKRRR